MTDRPAKPSRSIAVRLVAAAVVWIVAALVAGGFLLSNVFRTPLETAFDLVGLTVLAAILYAHWPIMIRAWERNDFVGAVGDFTAPTWPVKAMLALGAALLALQFLARIIRRWEGEDDESI